MERVCYVARTLPAIRLPICFVPTFCSPVVANVLGPVTLLKYLADRLLYPCRLLFQCQRITEQQSGAQDGANRVCLVESGQHGRAAVDRLLKAKNSLPILRDIPEASGWHHPHRTRKHRSFVAKDIPEEILRHHDIECLGVLNQAHHTGVDQRVLEYDAGMLKGYLVSDFTSEIR